MANIIDGKIVSQKIKDGLKQKVADFANQYGRQITLAVLLVGENPASQVYVKNKIKACEYVGIKSLSFNFPTDASEEEVIACVKELAQNDSVDGILVQLPLPKHISESKVLNTIPANKDVDGFLAENIGKLAMGEKSTVACTPAGILVLIKETGVELSGKNAVVIGRSNIVGKPISMLLLNENCTVTTCHSKTKNLSEITKNADVLVVAIGRPDFVDGSMIKEGAIVIDVGINRTESGLKGDVEFESASKVASYITPVPGGVGPMTIAMLMDNTYKCALLREENR